MDLLFNTALQLSNKSKLVLYKNTLSSLLSEKKLIAYLEKEENDNFFHNNFFQNWFFYGLLYGLLCSPFQRKKALCPRFFYFNIPYPTLIYNFPIYSVVHFSHRIWIKKKHSIFKNISYFFTTNRELSIIIKLSRVLIKLLIDKYTLHPSSFIEKWWQSKIVMKLYLDIAWESKDEVWIKLSSFNVNSKLRNVMYILLQLCYHNITLLFDRDIQTMLLMKVQKLHTNLN